MSVPDVGQLPHSIQGGYEKPPSEPLTVQEADEYVDSHSDGVIECRSQGRHLFPSPRRGQIVFDDIDGDGNFVAHYTCTRCACAVRREVWTTRRSGRHYRYEFLEHSLIYQRNSGGETYLLPPGTGRGRPVLFRESLMTSAMKGQTPGAIRKAIQRAGQARGSDDDG